MPGRPWSLGSAEALFRLVNVGMMAWFAWSAWRLQAVPGSSHEVAVFGVAGVLCLSATIGRPRWKLAAILALLSAVVAGLAGLGGAAPWQVGGLAVVVGWMLVLTVWWRRQVAGPG